jgi:hypothetical protein
MAGFQLSVFANDWPVTQSTSTTQQTSTVSLSTSTQTQSSLSTISPIDSTTFLDGTTLTALGADPGTPIRNWSFNGSLDGGTTNATYSTNVAPIPESNSHSLYFNGTDDQVRIEHDPALNSFPMSLSFWIKTSQTGYAGIISKYSTYNGYQIYLQDGILKASYFRDGVNHVRGIKAVNISDGKWHHIAFAIDQTGGSIFVDGLMSANLAWTGTAGAPTTTSPLYMGRFATTTGSRFNGSLDEVQFYNKRLTASEIATLAERKTEAIVEPPPPAPIGQLPMKGPLRVSKINPRYFEDENGKAIYLTGSHTWTNLSDRGTTNPPTPLNFDAHLDMLKANNHNFMRLWRPIGESTKYREDEGDPYTYNAQHPWARTGSTLAADGKPKFDLNKFDESYFTRLRQRVVAAKEHGIYVGVMLFEGFGLEINVEGWEWHPFNRSNNVNGVNGDTNNDGKGKETHTLNVDAMVTRLQEAYVKKVIDTIGDLDNVIYEVANETVKGSLAWQTHIAKFIQQYESTKPKQHPVGITVPYWNGEYSTIVSMDSSTITWTSPEQPYGSDPSAWKYNPPVGDGKKVILSDTDHLWGRGGTVDWVWKTFTRGHNTLYMDNLRTADEQPFVRNGENMAGHLAMRKNMGYTNRYAQKMDMNNMKPSTTVCSTKYCLAEAGQEYLVYQPGSGSFTVNLTGHVAEFTVEWFEPATGKTTAAGRVTGGSVKQFNPPFLGDAVLYLRRA